ncbi:MAG: hypothetical protein P8J78_01490 [Maricaulis sp.]|jgi:hypothetical protein|nr:hypothetical protein [Maricaulis sp.]MDG2043256.1 hypothetical protein [Maricaulis sp.]
MSISFKKIMALLVAVPLFLSLAWFFGVFLNPQGGGGAGFAFGLILASAAASIFVFSWIASPGPLVQLRHRGVDGVERGDHGVGLFGLGAHKDARRRRDETDGEDFSNGRRASSDMVGDGDVDDLGDGSIV